MPEYEVTLNVKGKRITDKIGAGDTNTAKALMRDRYGKSSPILNTKPISQQNLKK